MSAEQALRDGNLDQALAELQQEIRRQPAEAKLRVFLFQLLAVQGQWERALTQLNVAGELDAAATLMVQAYREAVQCEALRSEVFAGKRTPLVFGEPSEWLALLLEALNLSAQGQHDRAQLLRDQAFEAAPASAGTIRCGAAITAEAGDADSGEPFAWLADADTRLGPVLEALLNGRYYWIPLERIRQIDIEPPTDLRDMVWLPAHFEWTNGGDALGMIPTRYPGSEGDPNPRIRLARQTDWREPAPGVYLGAGQRLLATDGGEYALLDVRRITFHG